MVAGIPSVGLIILIVFVIWLLPGFLSSVGVKTPSFGQATAEFGKGISAVGLGLQDIFLTPIERLGRLKFEPSFRPTLGLKLDFPDWFKPSSPTATETPLQQATRLLGPLAADERLITDPCTINETERRSTTIGGVTFRVCGVKTSTPTAASSSSAIPAAPAGTTPLASTIITQAGGIVPAGTPTISAASTGGIPGSFTTIGGVLTYQV